MLYKTLSLLFSVVAIASVANSQDSCPVEIGSRVTFEDGKDIFERLSFVNPVKGEFETTDVFEARKAAARSNIDISKPIFAKAIYDPKQVTYDADRQAFIMKTYAWDNRGLSVKRAFPRGNPSGLKVGLFGDYEVVLQETTSVTGEYEASNAFGRAVTVVELTKVVYGVFDRPHSDADYGNIADWATTMTADPNQSPAIEVYVPIEDAPTVKSSMQVGIAISPKEPFVGSGEYTNTPKTSYPYEVTGITNVIVADILCAVIADEDGLVLATVKPGY